jgi:hypothetical protein
MALLRAFIAHLNEVPIKKSQTISRMGDDSTPVPEGAIATEAIVPRHYRQQAAEIMDKLLSLQGTFGVVKITKEECHGRVKKTITPSLTPVLLLLATVKEGRLE